MSEQSPRVVPQAYSIEGFCAAYSLSRSKVYELISLGKLHSVRVGGRRLIPAEAGEALLRSAAAA